MSLYVMVLAGIAVWLIYSLYTDLTTKTTDDLGIEGRVIWKDEGTHVKAFVNREYGVVGKPDLMYAIRGGTKAVEYKHRMGPIFSSDVAQGFAACLAARGEGYKVIQLECRTQTQSEIFELPTSDRALFKKIAALHKSVNMARNGRKLKALPQFKKCRACAYRGGCDDAVTH